MSPIDGLLLLIVLVLGVMAFRVTADMGWHWGASIFFGLVPLGITLLFGMIGLLASALFVGGLYKASAR